jgi:peptidylamidoglycolate lyase
VTQRYQDAGLLVAIAILAAAASLHGETHAGESHAIDRSWPAASAICRPGRFQVPGVALADDGRIVVLTRGDHHWMPGTAFRRQMLRESPVLAISSTGDSEQAGPGAGAFMMPHQITVDPHGHAWIVDVGLHSIVEFDAEGRKVRALGGPKVRFNMPTDVAFLSDGSFVVSDGYGNSRVVKFAPDGRVVASWGRRGSGRVEFQTPHSVAVDDRDRIYVADRENDRVQVLTSDGDFIAEWTDVGRPLTVRVAAGSVWVLSNLDAAAGIVRRLSPEGKEIESFHTRPLGDGGDFEWPHGLAVSADGDDVYVGFTLTGRRVQRYRRVVPPS